MHLLSGNEDGVRRWRLTDRQEVGKQTAVAVSCISVSRDHKWVVCGSDEGASVWNERMDEKITEVEVTKAVVAVDASPDSTRFAVGITRPDNQASIWSMKTGRRLVGPLQHDDEVTGIKFSQDGELVATACSEGSVRIFNSRKGDELVTINTAIPEWSPITPFAWSSDSQRILSACRDNKIRAFDSTGSQHTESLSFSDSGKGYRAQSIALAANGKFIATGIWESILFLDALTLKQIGPVIKDSGQIRSSIAISADSSYLATGQRNGKIVIHDLSNILPPWYGPFHVSRVCTFIIPTCWISPIVTHTT